MQIGSNVTNRDEFSCHCCPCLPVRTFAMLRQGSYVEVVCKVVCYVAVKRGQ